MSVAGRSSSITNAFISAIIPIIDPTEAEEIEALGILGMSPNNIQCVYCGDKETEWDHLRPIISNQEPTGYITELANLVPSCGKCNQSKGKSHWRSWMEGTAPRSPTTRGIPDLKDRIAHLTAYEAWRQPTKIDFAAVAGPEMWQRHRKNWRDVLGLLKKSQELASEIRGIIAKAGGVKPE
ncbi:MAG: HNH endonuclease [Elusimicrobia bacterium]|nr:HNH endonuclease [Elusimicrobiota bacterium]